jgi:hypothetical protein
VVRTSHSGEMFCSSTEVSEDWYGALNMLALRVPLCACMEVLEASRCSGASEVRAASVASALSLREQAGAPKRKANS